MMHVVRKENENGIMRGKKNKHIMTCVINNESIIHSGFE